MANHSPGQANPNYSHGHTVGRKGSPEYVSWNNMRQRCHNIKNPKYPIYGGRGIQVCERWCNSFKNFLADMGVRPEGTTLDRINNDGNYEPGNCRWATPKAQGNNRRRRSVLPAHDQAGRFTCRTADSPNGTPRFTNDEILAILTRRTNGEAYARIAADFGAHKCTVYRIVNRNRTWDGKRA